MNRNKDCNDGIPKAISDMYDRYPYAKDPNAALQNMNYKDWLVMSPGDSQNGLPDKVTTAAIGTAVVGTLLWGFVANPIVGGVASVICAFATLFPILWPDRQEPKKVWAEFMANGEEAFGKKMQEVERSRALSYLAAMKKELEKYEDALEAWKKNKTRETAEAVKREFNDAGDYIDNKLEELKLNGYQHILLSCYAQAAFLHLNLLEQGVKLGDKWDQYSDSLQTSTSSDYWYKLLLKRMEEYIDYCTKTYNEGLVILKNSKWTTYNAYRRDMTLTVLDLIALFPNFDNRKYPMKTKTQLTREIYTNPLITGLYNDELTVDVGEKQLTRNPHLFTWFNGVRCYTRKRGYDVKRDALCGIKNVYKNTNSADNESIDSPLYGNAEGQIKNKVVDPGLDIRKLNIRRYKLSENTNPNGIQEIKCSIHQAGGEFKEGYPLYSVESLDKRFEEKVIQPEQPELDRDKNPAALTHTLSSMFVYEKLKGNGNHGALYTYSFAWTHDSVDRKNTIAKDMITQIPAVKALPESKVEIIKGPGHTGGDIVKFKSHVDSLRMVCTVEEDTLQRIKYKVRIRYAAKDNWNLSLYFSDRGQTYTKQLPKTYSGDDYTKSSSFQYIDLVEERLLYDSSLELFLTSPPDDSGSSKESFLIDKIEFIPLGPVQED
ncbi:insecticidal delta-endotoxin Cry8Ea1 family protein [Bacillus cereus]|uniref:insecticidal delta-endotoxin Cry8Ea1 family protein n=1 Tax=Bacillus cereus TaxID=1396 RepID=UPI0009AB1167|nr:insecticidal delta-endotoxin Cry8Ea1 family protein [Bacillus cereus]PES30626.1 hypothetical protein CN496_08410 [Bacillus cereus]